MSIIIQAGHHSSRSKFLIQKLYERGLSKPLNSYTHQFDAQQVADTINKVVLRNNKSIINKKLVDNVMIDLLLANLDYENWGWESEKNLAALEYWQHIESDIQFIFVFDHPSRLLNQLSSQSLTIEAFDKAMNHWVAYHQNILGFLEVNQDNVLLVEGNCAINNICDLKKQLKNIAPTLQLKDSWQISDQIEDSSEYSLDHHYHMIREHFFGEVLSQYPEVIKLFNSLLDKASIKDSNPIIKAKKNDIDSLINLLSCLEECNLFDKYREQEENNIALKKMLDDITKDKKKIEDEYIEFKHTLSSYKSENKTDSNKYISGLEETNELLIEQLQLAQEKIEGYYSNSSNIKTDIANSNSNIVYTKGAAEAVKKELPYVLGSTIVRNSKSVKGIVKLPASLLKEHKTFKNNENVSLNIEMYADSDEAEKVKRHLSYKIGKVFVEGFDSPKNLIKLPFAMIREVSEFKKK